MFLLSQAFFCSGKKRKGTIPIATYSKKKKTTVKTLQKPIGIALFSNGEETKENHLDTQTSESPTSSSSSSPPTKKLLKKTSGFSSRLNSRLSNGTTTTNNTKNQPRQRTLNLSHRSSCFSSSLYSSPRPSLTPSRSRQDGFVNSFS